MIKHLLLLWVLTFTDSVLISLNKGSPICLSIDIDAHKTLHIESHVISQPQCRVQLTVDTNTEIGIVEGNNFIRKEFDLFDCSSLLSANHILKFTGESQDFGFCKFRVCVESLDGRVTFSLVMNQVTTPDFQELDEELSLVGSQELVDIRNKMGEVLGQVLEMEPMEQSYVRTEEMVFNKFQELRQQINLATKVQIVLIVMIGVAWVLALRLMQKGRS